MHAVHSAFSTQFHTPITVWTDSRNDELVSGTVIATGAKVVLVTLVLFVIAAIIVAGVVLEPGLLTIGAFVGFGMMSLIGMPLILATLSDALESRPIAPGAL